MHFDIYILIFLTLTAETGRGEGRGGMKRKQRSRGVNTRDEKENIQKNQKIKEGVGRLMLEFVLSSSCLP